MRRALEAALLRSSNSHNSGEDLDPDRATEKGLLDLAATDDQAIPILGLTRPEPEVGNTDSQSSPGQTSIVRYDDASLGASVGGNDLVSRVLAEDCANLDRVVPRVPQEPCDAAWNIVVDQILHWRRFRPQPALRLARATSISAGRTSGNSSWIFFRDQPAATSRCTAATPIRVPATRSWPARVPRARSTFPTPRRRPRRCLTRVSRSDRMSRSGTSNVMVICPGCRTASAVPAGPM